MINFSDKIKNKGLKKVWVILLSALIIFSGLFTTVKAQYPNETNFQWEQTEEDQNEWPLDSNLSKSYIGIGTAGFSYGRYYFNDNGQIVIELELSIFPDDTIIDFGSNYRTFRNQWDYANIFIDPNLVGFVDEQASFFMMSYPFEAFPKNPTKVSLSVATKPEANNIYKLNINDVFPNIPTYSDYMKSKLYLILKEGVTLTQLQEDYAVQLRYTNIKNQVYEQRGTKGGQVLGSYYGHVEKLNYFDASANNDDVTLKTMVPFQTASMTNTIPNPILPPDMMRTVAQSVVYDNVNGTLSIYYRLAPNHYIYTNPYANNGYFLSSWIGIRQVMDARIYDALKPDANGNVGYMRMFDLDGVGSGWNVTTSIKANEFSYTKINEEVSTYSYMLVPKNFKTDVTNKAVVATSQTNNVKNVYLHGHKKESDFVRFVYYVDKNMMDAIFENINSSSLSISTSYITDRPTETNQTEYRLTASEKIVIPEGAKIVFDLPKGSRSIFRVGLNNNYERVIGDLATKRPTSEMNHYGVDPTDFGRAYTMAPYFATEGGFVLNVETGLTIASGEVISLTMFDASSPATVTITVVDGTTRTNYTLSKHLVNENKLYTMPNANVRSGIIVNRSANTPHVDEFFTDSVSIKGHSKYPDALVSIRKSSDNIVIKEAYSSTTAESFYAEGNPTALSGYVFTLDIPSDAKIKKDMTLSFSNAATGYFRSKASTYRAQAKVTFSKNDGTGAVEERIVPINEKAYEDVGYTANGFEGANILWLDASGNVTTSTATEKYFSSYEGKPIKEQTEIEKRTYYENPTREGYTFLGWSTKQVDSMSLTDFNNLPALTDVTQWDESTNYKFIKTSPVDESRTVYAVWQKNLETYQFIFHHDNSGVDITYALNIPVANVTGGSTDELTAYLNANGNVFKDLGFYKEGHYFVGWAETLTVSNETEVHQLYTNSSKVQVVNDKLQLQLNEEPVSNGEATHINLWKDLENQPVNNNGVATIHLYAQYKPLLTMTANVQWYAEGELAKFELDPENYAGEHLNPAPFNNTYVAMVLLRTTEGKTLDPTKYEIIPGFYVAGKNGQQWQWAPQEGHDANGRKYYYLMTEFNTQILEHTEEDIIRHFYENRTWVSLYITMVGKSDHLSKYTALSFDDNGTSKNYLAVATSNQPGAKQYVNDEEAGYDFLLKNFEIGILPAMIHRVQENHDKVVINTPTDGAKYLYLIIDGEDVNNRIEFKKSDENIWYCSSNSNISVDDTEGKLTIKNTVTPFNFEGRAGDRVYAIFTISNEDQAISNINKYASRAIQPYTDLPTLEEIAQKPHLKDENGNITHNVITAKIPTGSYAEAEYTLGYMNGTEFVAITDAEGKEITVKPDANERLNFVVPQGKLDPTVSYVIMGIDKAETYRDTKFDVPELDFTAPEITANSFDLLTGDLIGDTVGTISTNDTSATITYKVTKDGNEVSLPDGLTYDAVNNKFIGKTADTIDPTLTGDYIISIIAEDQFGNVSNKNITLKITQKPTTDSIVSITQNYNLVDGSASLTIVGKKDAAIKFYSKNDDGSFMEIEIEGLSGNVITNEDGSINVDISQADVKRFNNAKIYVTQVETAKLESNKDDYTNETIDRPNNIKSVVGAAIVVDNVAPTPLYFVQPLAGTNVLKITNISADENVADVSDVDMIIIKIGNNPPCTLEREYINGVSTGKWTCNLGYDFQETEEEFTVVINPNTGETETRTVGVLNFVLDGTTKFEEFQNISAQYFDYLGNGSAEVSVSVPKLPDPIAPYDMKAVNDSQKHPTTTIITGKADPGALISVVVDGQIYQADVDVLGDFTLEIPKQDKGENLTLTSKLNNYYQSADVSVTEVEADTYDVTVKNISKSYGQATSAKEVFNVVKVIGYPEGENQPTFSLKKGTTLPNGRVSGEHKVAVVVTYPDGSSEIVEVKVKVGAQPHNQKYHPEVEDEVIMVNGQIDLTNNVLNMASLPAGTTIKDTTSTAIDTSVAGTYTGQITVTYPDGTKDVVNVKIIVKEEPLTAAEKYTATANVVNIDEGVSLTEEDIINTVVISPELEDGTTAKITILSPLPTTGTNNEVKVLITYSDNTTDNVTIIVNFNTLETPPVKEGSWSLVSLVVTLISAIAMVVQLLAKTVKDDDGVSFVRNKTYKVVTALLALTSVIYFIFSNNLSLPMQIVNETTLISSIITIVTMASLGFGLRWKED